MSRRRDDTTETYDLRKARENAEHALDEMATRAAGDPTRPTYHFLPVAGWMNDPNGTIHRSGWFHLFYQHNPYADVWNTIHWGHARSRDLVNWEHLPIALFPSRDLGEDSCFSGCCTITPAGQPVIFYTKVGPRPEHAPREQWAALGDEELLAWKKHPRNPILTVDNHGGPAIKGDWRDPYVFHTEGRTFMVVAATLADKAGGDFVVLLYESADPELSRWTFRNILIRKPGYEMSFFECPNFVKFGDRWMLLVSPYKPVEYYTGTFNLSTYTFAPSTHGRLDSGMDYYATNTAEAPDGRIILFGWVRGFRRGHGWDGCLALPRELDVDDAGNPVQRPARELERLRSDLIELEPQRVDEHEIIVGRGRDYSCAEVECSFSLGPASAVELRLLRADDGRSAVDVQYDGHVFDVHGTKVPYDTDGEISLHLYIDRTVIEVFIDGGRKCLTKVVYTDEGDTGLSLRALGGEARLIAFRAWTLKAARISV